MPKFTVITTATAAIEEVWVVKARNAEDARAAIEDQEWDEVEMISVEDRILGEEENRVVDRVEVADE